MSLQEDLGQVQVSHATVAYTSRFYTSWEIDVPDIRIIGEWTDESGPYCEDHFLAFVTKTGQCLDLPFRASGFSQAMRQIKHLLDASLESKLMFSTRLNSVVLWPSALEGRPLFRFCQTEAHGVLYRIVHAGLSRPMNREYDEAVSMFLKNSS